MFQVLQTLTFAWNNSTEAFETRSSASQHSDVTVRLFESDTRAVGRARLRVHSTWVPGNSTRLHAEYTTVVILGVTVDFLSMFLLRSPGQPDFRSRQVTSTQCTQLTLETLDFALHGGEGDVCRCSRNFFSLGLTRNHAYRNVEGVCTTTTQD